jgi:hypothetical protein
MNERIQELLDQCISPELTKPWPLIDAEKFAQLIVRGCVSVAMEHYDDTLPWGGVEDVLKHFGVEE